MVLIEHDLIDYINAASTVVIAAFTVLMFFVVKYQLRASKDIERGWLMPRVEKDSYGGLLCETTTQEQSVSWTTTTTTLNLKFRNDGNGPVWVKRLQARLVLLNSIEQLPKTPKLNDDDDQHWCPAPFVDSDELKVRLNADGSRDGKHAVIYGKIRYLDKFRAERVSTFGYVICWPNFEVKRLESHPEYNRNT
jgi:hypothetical protein